MEKPPLSEFIRTSLCEKYGSTLNASKEIGINYPRLKKAIQRNGWSFKTLMLVLPACTEMEIGDLHLLYTFKVSGTGAAHKKEWSLSSEKESYSKLSNLKSFIEMIDQEDSSLIRDNAIVRDRLVLLIQNECATIRSLLVD